MKPVCISAFLQGLIASAALLAASDSSAREPAAQAIAERLVVVMDDAYPPYAFRDSEGDLRRGGGLRQAILRKGQP